MQFALFGDHPDGLAMARALVDSGNHGVSVYSGSALGAKYLERWDIPARQTVDIEDALADRSVEGVIVAGPASVRGMQLRRAMQSEKHVLCVHPADESVNSAYEAAVIQKDTAKVVMPILPDGLHPALLFLANEIENERQTAPPRGINDHGPFPHLIQITRHLAEAGLLESDFESMRPAFSGWEVLRALGGNIAEVFAYSNFESPSPGDIIWLSGRFEQGGAFQYNIVPFQPQSRLTVTYYRGRFSWVLQLAEGLHGPATLTWTDDHGETQQKHWDAWQPWSTLVEQFDYHLRRLRPSKPTADKHFDTGMPQLGLLEWEDEIRSLELDDAAWRSLDKRRASTLEYLDDTEEASFKGAMTLMGCALLWGSLLLLILSIWIPWLGWLVVPLILLFLGFQIFRFIIPPKQTFDADADEQEKGKEP